MTIWCILNIFFAEKLPANNGIGWDGLKYASIARDYLNSSQIDNYIIMRIFPSTLVHIFCDVFSISYTDYNIIKGFEILNMICLVTSVVFVKKIFVVLDIKFKNQLLGFTLLFISYPVLKFNFFYPVMTDTSAFVLSIILLYCFLKNQVVNLVLISSIGFFTFPTIFYMGIIMLLFPINFSEWKPIVKSKQILISVLSSLYIVVIIYYFTLIIHANTEMYGAMKINYQLIYLSIALIVLLYYFLPVMVFNSDFFDINYLIQQIKINRILLAIFIFSLLLTLKNELNLYDRHCSNFTIENMLKTDNVYNITEPLMPIISDGTYFGSVILLLLLFWSTFSKTIANYGLGLVLSFLFILYALSTTTESRCIINLFPWLVIFLVKGLNQYNFNRLFYFTIFIINIILSKIWLSVNYDMSCGLDKNGTIAFPNQKFFMNLGPWMSKEMWLLQGIVLAVFLTIIFFILNRIEIKNGIRSIKKFS